MNYQKVDAVYLLVNRPLLSEMHWMYFVDDDICINRMVEFKNMSPVDLPSDTTVVCAEVTQMHDDPVSKVIADLGRAGLLRPDEVLDTYVLRENFAYPVYDQVFDQTIEMCLKNPEKTNEILSHIAKNRDLGMQTFDQHLIELVKARKISLEDAMVASEQSDQIQRDMTLEP